jgi:NADH-quinone oxidoreductase subunit J
MLVQVSPALFFLFVGMALAFSVMVVVRRSPMTAAFSLILVFFSFAAIYAMLGAHLLAALQVLVYAGAIMVLFAFVILLLNAKIPKLDINRRGVLFRVVAGIACLAAFCGFSWFFRRAAQLPSLSEPTVQAAEAVGNTQAVSELLFSRFVLPFELTSVLLLAAIVGAVIMA